MKTAIMVRRNDDNLAGKTQRTEVAPPLLYIIEDRHTERIAEPELKRECERATYRIIIT